MNAARAEALRLLRDFSQAHGASGAEGAVRDIFRRELPGASFTTDKLGGLYFENTGGDAARVMVTAHMDEVGFMVQSITPDGFLKFAPLGGWSENTLLAQRVRVLTRAARELPGVITSLPPHFTGGDGKTTPAIDNLHIDLGLESGAAVRAAGVALGDTIVPDGPWMATAHPDRFIAKAFDNRAGCAALAQVFKHISGVTLPCRPVGVATVQEEVGCRGAIISAARVAPAVAIVLEGPPADDTPGFSRTEAQGALGAGVQIRLFDPSAIQCRPLADFAAGVAARHGVPFQVTVRRGGGTDAKSIHTSGDGVPTIVLGVPARYIHTHGAMLDIRDHLACVALTRALLEELTPEIIAGFTRF